MTDERARGRSEAFRLAVVGGGPRSTYALERLAATIDRLNGRRLAVHVYELAGEFGAGQVHSAEQPHSSYLNRAGSQVSFAADPTVLGADPIRAPKERPTLHERCRRASRRPVTRPSTWRPPTHRAGVNTAWHCGRCSTATWRNCVGCPGSASCCTPRR